MAGPTQEAQHGKVNLTKSSELTSEITLADIFTDKEGNPSQPLKLNEEQMKKWHRVQEFLLSPHPNWCEIEQYKELIEELKRNPQMKDHPMLKFYEMHCRGLQELRLSDARKVGFVFPAKDVYGGGGKLGEKVCQKYQDELREVPFTFRRSPSGTAIKPANELEIEARVRPEATLTTYMVAERLDQINASWGEGVDYVKKSYADLQRIKKEYGENSDYYVEKVNEFNDYNRSLKSRIWASVDSTRKSVEARMVDLIRKSFEEGVEGQQPLSEGAVWVLSDIMTRNLRSSDPVQILIEQTLRKDIVKERKPSSITSYDEACAGAYYAWLNCELAPYQKIRQSFDRHIEPGSDYAKNDPSKDGILPVFSDLITNMRCGYSSSLQESLQKYAAEYPQYDVEVGAILADMEALQK